MSNIEEKILYHLSRTNPWSIGAHINIGESYNPFWQYYVNYSPVFELNKNRDLLCDIFNTTYPSPNPPVTEETIRRIYNQLLDISKTFSLYIREQTFEAVRIKDYDKLPSRQKCLWLTDEQNIDHWKKEVLNNQGYLYTLKVSGNIFRGDNAWLHADTFSSSIYEERAKKYWSGETGPKSCTEYIFCGEATVLDLSDLSISSNS